MHSHYTVSVGGVKSKVSGVPLEVSKGPNAHADKARVKNTIKWLKAYATEEELSELDAEFPKKSHPTIDGSTGQV